MLRAIRPTTVITAALALGLGLLIAPVAQASSIPPVVEWAKQANPVPIGGSTYFNAEASAGVVTDSAGNSYAAGTFTGQITIGSTTLQVEGDPEQNRAMYVVKFSPAGDVVWAKRYGSAVLYTYAKPSSIALDAAGNIYLTGEFFGEVNFGGGVSIASDPNGLNWGFAAKVDSSGAGVWAHVITPPQFGIINPRAIAASTTGRAVVVGQHRGETGFGTETITCPGGYCSFVASYDASGAVEWVKSFVPNVVGLDSEIKANAVVVDSSGNAYVGGAFSPMTVDFAGIRRTNSRANDSAPYVVRLAPNGTGMWVDDFATVTAGTISSLALDGEGQLLVGGTVAGSLTIGSSVVTNCFAGRYSPGSGTGQWGLSCGQSTSPHLAARGSTIVLAARLTDDTIGGVPIINAPALPASVLTTFVTSVTTAGSVSWAQAVQVAANSSATTTGAAVGTQGSPVIVGNFLGGWRLGTKTLDAPSARSDAPDSFFAAFAGPPALTPTTQTVTGSTGTPIVPTVAPTPARMQAPVTYTVTPALPAGLSLAPSTGVISGTPTAAVTSTPYTVTATDAAGRTATTRVTIQVSSSELSPPSQTVTGTVGTPITPTASLSATGLTAPLTFSVAPALPAGLQLSPTTGVISGTPTAVHASSVHTITATDASTPARTATATVSIAITAAAALTPSTQSISGTVGVEITPSQAFTATGMTTPLVYSISPALPAGLRMSNITGVISGTPTAAQDATTYTVTVVDASTPSRSAAATVTVSIAVPPITKPGAVTNLTARPQKGKAVVTWKPPADTGGAAITGYRVRIGKGKWATQTATRVTVTKLKKGNQVIVSVRAVNSAGLGPITKVTAKSR